MDKLMTSRKEKRKAARHEKKQHKHQSFLTHQKLRKAKRNSENISLKSESGSDSDRDEAMKTGRSLRNFRRNTNNNVNDREMPLTESESDGDFVRMKPRKGDQKVSGKRTKFEEYLEMETKTGSSAREDLEMERRLAKKLKVRLGKLRDDDDELNFLVEGIPSVFDASEGDSYVTSESEMENVLKKRNKKKKKISSEQKDQGGVVGDSDGEHDQESLSFELGEEDSEAESIESEKNKKRKSKKSLRDDVSDDVASSARQAKSMSSEFGEEAEANITSQGDSIVANGVGGSSKYVAPQLRSVAGDNSQEYVQIRRRVRGLLNRLSESNVESITGEISQIFQSASRAVASQIISEEVLASCSGGPRGNEQYAAIFAAFVAGMACIVGIDFGARLMESLAKSFEDEYLKEDNLSLRNLSLLLSYLCMFGVSSSDLIYDFLLKLSRRLTEIDVSTILTILQCCGMKLRGDDPTSMKDFIISVQSRVNELKASSGGEETKAHGKRMEFMLETICDIKNNKRRAKDDSPQHTRIKKWLQKLRVEDIALRGIKWSRLLDPNKKGQWWFSGNVPSVAEDVEKVAGKIDREADEAQKMLQLAGKLRMNTDTRRAIFCVVMSGEDYLDAFEKLLRLNLQGKQDREIMRVLVECCLQEKVFNKYYTALATKLCSHDKNHKFTLQYCLWDQFKELESMTLMRSMHLAKFVAEMIASFTLSLAVLKAVDLIDGSLLTAKRIMHFRMLFEAILKYPDNVVWNVFTRVAVAPELEELRNGMELFIREYVLTANKDTGKKFKLAKKALKNAEGVLM